MVTREQAVKWNEQAKKVGFELDINMLIFHKEKQIKKIVTISDSEKMEYTVSYCGVYKNYRPIGYNIKVNRSRYTKTTNDMWMCEGLGHSIKISDEVYEKKNYKKLLEVAGALPSDIEKYFNTYKENGLLHDDGNGVVISSTY